MASYPVFIIEEPDNEIYNHSRGFMPYSDEFDSTNVHELRVAGDTVPKNLAASIIHLLNDNKQVRLSAIGHQSVGQAVKAIPVVNQYTVAQGYLIAIFPSFELQEVPTRDVMLEDTRERTTERTVMMLKLVRISPQ